MNVQIYIEHITLIHYYFMESQLSRGINAQSNIIIFDKYIQFLIKFSIENNIENHKGSSSYRYVHVLFLIHL